MDVVAGRLKFIGVPDYKHYKENIKRGTMGIALAASSYLIWVFKSGWHKQEWYCFSTKYRWLAML